LREFRRFPKFRALQSLPRRGPPTGAQPQGLRCAAKPRGLRKDIFESLRKYAAQRHRKT
jgi:hypothetical protein